MRPDSDSGSFSETLRGARPPEPSEIESEEGLFKRDFDEGSSARKRLLRSIGCDAVGLPEALEVRLAG